MKTPGLYFFVNDKKKVSVCIGRPETLWTTVNTCPAKSRN